MASQKQAQSRASSERPRGKSLGPLRTLVPFLGPYRRTLLAALSALLIASGAMLALPIALRYLIDNGFIAQDAATVNRYFGWFLAAALVFSAFAALRYYLVYRAMVRAKVDCLRAHQPDVDTAARTAILQDYHAYIELAGRYTKPRPSALLLMHGLSGSGKTTVSQFLLENLPAIRMRSDVERKRLYGLAGDARAAADIDRGIYNRAADERTYRQLAMLAGTVLDAGHSVIVDATFLQQAQLTPFIELAHARTAHCFIIDCQAPESELRQRITARQCDRQDASEAGVEVLESQLLHYRPLDTSAIAAEILVAGSDATAMAGLVTLLHKRLR